MRRGSNNSHNFMGNNRPRGFPGISTPPPRERFRPRAPDPNFIIKTCPPKPEKRRQRKNFYKPGNDPMQEYGRQDDSKHGRSFNNLISANDNNFIVNPIQRPFSSSSNLNNSQDSEFSNGKNGFIFDVDDDDNDLVVFSDDDEDHEEDDEDAKGNMEFEIHSSLNTSFSAPTTPRGDHKNQFMQSPVMNTSNEDKMDLDSPSALDMTLDNSTEDGRFFNDNFNNNQNMNGRKNRTNTPRPNSRVMPSTPFNPVANNLITSNNSHQNPVNQNTNQLRFSTQRIQRQIQNPSRQNVAYHSRYMEDFIEVEELGDGHFGKVMKCRNRFDGMNYAIKQLKGDIRGDMHMKEVLREVHALSRLDDSPYIVRYYGSWVENEQLYVQTEVCEGGNLFSYLLRNDKIPEAMLCQIILHVTKGLQIMHARNLVHLDIKPENIFMSGRNFKIGDFGLVARNLDWNRDIKEGDGRYLPKEILALNHPPNMDLKKVDVFCLGATILEMMRGSRNPLPLNGEDWHGIRKGKIKVFQNYSRELQGLVRLMLNENPATRPSTTQILQNATLNKVKPSYEDLLRRVQQLENQLDEGVSTEESLRRKICTMQESMRMFEDDENIFSTSI